MTIEKLRRALRAAARPEAAGIAQKFFKTGPGEYAEGDRFIGVRVPDIRLLVRSADGISEEDVLQLVRSEIHEERLLGLFIWVRRFEKGDEKTRKEIFRAMLGETRSINNWDLVDSAAPQIVGGWVFDHPADRKILFKLARSKVLWERRIAIVSTLFLIREGELTATLEIAEMLLHDPHDLIHKATGWMLREAGKKEVRTLRDFLGKHATGMPRTMLRYAIEKLSPAERGRWMLRNP